MAKHRGKKIATSMPAWATQQDLVSKDKSRENTSSFQVPGLNSSIIALANCQATMWERPGE